MTLRRPSRGFTLIEIMVTLTIIAIMMGIGVPAFRTFTDGQKVKAASYELSTTFAIARSEAIKRNTTITIAPVTAGAWSNGWTVKAAPSATLVHEQGAFTLVTIARLPSGAPANVLFQPSGRPDPASSSASKTYFQITGSKNVRCITLDAVGIPSVTTTSCP